MGHGRDGGDNLEIKLMLKLMLQSYFSTSGSFPFLIVGYHCQGDFYVLYTPPNALKANSLDLACSLKVKL